MPGLFSCAAGMPIPPKTIVASRAGVYALLQNACWGPDPKLQKSTATGGLFPSRSSLPYSAPARARSRSTCGAFARQRKRPLPGDWGRPQQADYTGFRKGENLYNRFVYTTKHCLPLLRTVKREVRIIPIRIAKDYAHNRNKAILTIFP